MESGGLHLAEQFKTGREGYAHQQGPGIATRKQKKTPLSGSGHGAAISNSGARNSAQSPTSSARQAVQQVVSGGVTMAEQAPDSGTDQERCEHRRDRNRWIFKRQDKLLDQRHLH